MSGRARQRASSLAPSIQIRADRRRPAATWHAAIGALAVLWLAGCAAGAGHGTDPGSRVPVADVGSIAGRWSGLLEISGRRHEDFVEMTINPDGTYRMHGARTIGTLDGQGRVEASGGTLRFQGPRATATGTVYERDARRTLVIEGRSERGERVTARLGPKAP